MRKDILPIKRIEKLDKSEITLKAAGSNAESRDLNPDGDCAAPITEKSDFKEAVSDVDFDSMAGNIKDDTSGLDEKSEKRPGGFKKLASAWIMGHESLLLMIPLGIAAAVFFNILFEVLPFDKWFPQYRYEIRPVMFRYPLITGLLLYGIAVPIFEELLFRFFLFGRLRIYIHTVAAGVASSVVFGIYHGNIVQFFYAFLFGLILCYGYWKADTLTAPILLHGSANCIVYITASIGVFHFLSEPPYQYIALAVSGLITALILFRLTKIGGKRSLLPIKPIFPR